MDTLADVVTELISAEGAGFDVGEAKALEVAQRAVKRLAATSHWIKAQKELGPTVAGQALYAIPDSIVRLLDLLVGENTPYSRRDLRILWDLRAGRDVLTRDGEEGGVYAEAFDSSGTVKSFEIFPTPETDGLIVQGLCSIVPEDLAKEAPLPFPDQHRGAILDFARAELYELTDENIQQAATYEGRGLKTAESLYLLGNARTGSGPWRIPVAGHRRR